MNDQILDIRLSVLVKDSYTIGELDELCGIAHMIETGESLFKSDHALALSIYDLCARYGHAVAINNLGWMILNGMGADKDVNKAILAFEDSAKRGCALAMVNLGNIYENMENCAEAEFGDYRKSGNVIYLKRTDATENELTDYAKAAEWYKKAYEAGNAKGAFNYATMLHFGRGIEKNHKAAFEIFDRLRGIDYLEAYFYMGLYYQEGLAVQQNYETARRFYTIGATKGDAYSYNQLGQMYAEGLGVKQDYKFAFEYYTLAHEGGDNLAAANIGWMYYNGLGVEQDYGKAFEWTNKAVSDGVGIPEDLAGPLNQLGWMYQNGHGTEQDYKKAVEFYKKAAELKDVEAIKNLARMYEHGIGVKKDLVAAITYYKDASWNYGDSEAADELGRIHEEYKGTQIVIDVFNDLDSKENQGLLSQLVNGEHSMKGGTL
jgi:TPR repeat protein